MGEAILRLAAFKCLARASGTVQGNFQERAAEACILTAEWTRVRSRPVAAGLLRGFLRSYRARPPTPRALLPWLSSCV